MTFEKRQEAADKIYMKMQLELLQTTMKTIADNAPGMMFEVLRNHLRKIGGDAWSPSLSEVAPKGENAFRIQVVTETIADLQNANKVRYVTSVIRWG